MSKGEVLAVGTNANRGAPLSLIDEGQRVLVDLNLTIVSRRDAQRTSN
jgi:hypothetical protein